MERYVISKEWLISESARRFYRWSAIISFGLFPVIFVFLWLGIERQLTANRETFLQACLMVTVLATAVVMVGMEYFLFTMDQSAGWKQFLWFLVMLIIGLGPGLYVLFGYSRSEHFQKSAKAVAANGPAS